MKKKFKSEVHTLAPEGFSPHVEVAACYLEIDDKLLLLLRANVTLEPSKWGVPAGKLESGETPEEGAKRELFEETGISIENPSRIEYLDSLYIRKPEVDYVYHIFRVQLHYMPVILLSPNEHQSYHWATSKDLEKLPLMDGAIEALQHYKMRLNMKNLNTKMV